VQAEIREVKSRDYELLARFFADNDIEAVRRYFHPFPLDSATAYRIASVPRLDRYYIALQNDEIVALGMLRGWDEGYEVPSFGLMVGSRHQELGLGKKMTEFAIRDALRLRCRKVRLSVYKSNSRAMSLFSSVGFEEIGSEPACLAGESDTKVFMSKELA
jgi:[ribosomal protein S18]-alanine N-acetyltransferase